MAITLGILSLFQLVFLPGLVVSQLTKLRGTGNIFLVSIALSPIINYIFVLTATALGIYNRQVTLIFFGIELMSLIYLNYPIFNKTLGQVLDYQEGVLFFGEYLYENSKKMGRSGIFARIFLIVVLSLATVSVFYYISLYVGQNMSTFTDWDAVVSWDRWAVDWYNNTFPVNTWHYPQLIPANWSLTYQFMGDSRIKFFAKEFMGFIEIYILVAIFFLGIIKRKVGYFFGVIFVAWLQWVFGSHGSGYVDTSVAFFSLSSVACLLIATSDNDQYKPTYIFIGAILAAGAAITKQAGLWMALIYPLLLLFTSNKKENRKYVYRFIPGVLAIYTLIIFPWYGFKEYQIQTGNDHSEINTVTSLAQQDRSWDEQLNYSLELLQTKITYQSVSGKLIVILLGVLMLFAYTDRFYRYLLVLIIIPFTLLWALYFSYDTRNLNLVVPLIGLTAGIGLQKTINNLKTFFFWLLLKITLFFNRSKRIDGSLGFRGSTKTLSTKSREITRKKQRKPVKPAKYVAKLETSKSLPRKIRKTRIDILFSPVKTLGFIKVIYLFIPLLAIFLLPFRYSDLYILNSSIAMQKKIGSATVNRNLYDYQSKYGFEGKILTDYQYLGFLPELEKYYELGFSAQPITFLKQIEETQIAHALLNYSWMSPEVVSYVDQNIVLGRMKIIFKKGDYMFVTTCRGPCDE